MSVPVTDGDRKKVRSRVGEGAETISKKTTFTSKTEKLGRMIFPAIDYFQVGKLALSESGDWKSRPVGGAEEKSSATAIEQ